MRENETFRLELEQIREAFPNKAVISSTELQQYLGKSKTWLYNHGLSGRDFTLVKVAQFLSNLR